MNKYDKIIDLAHYEPKNHMRMSIAKRSAIFSHFSALSGYYEEIEKMKIVYQTKISLSEDEQNLLDYQLGLIRKNTQSLYVVITYFQKKQNNLGLYQQIGGYITKIDDIKKEIVVDNNLKISINDISNIKI